jgi:hypothetical protein
VVAGFARSSVDVNSGLTPTMVFSRGDSKITLVEMSSKQTSNNSWDSGPTFLESHDIHQEVSILRTINLISVTYSWGEKSFPDRGEIKMNDDTILLQCIWSLM